MLDRRLLLGLLEDLSTELEVQGLRGEMFVVGGGAMALAYNTRRVTRDLDAVFEPKAVIYEASRRVAARQGIEEHWLSDAVKAFLPGDDPSATVLFERPGLAVRIASARYLLAMKVMAARVERDEDDIKRLTELCGLGSSEEVLDLVVDIYPHVAIPPRVQFFLAEMLDGPEGPR